MMFSSNQILKISGELNVEYVKKALKLALEYSGEIDALNENRSELVYCKTKDSFCIGWYLGKGWTKFDFDFNLEIIARIIIQFLEKQDFSSEFDDYDGLLRKGFIMQDFHESYDDDSEVFDKFYGIVEFKPYCCYYAK